MLSLACHQLWTEQAFARFFQEIGKEVVTNDLLEWLSALFRASEATFGTMSREDAERFAALSRLRTKRVLDALREEFVHSQKATEFGGTKSGDCADTSLDARSNADLAAYARTAPSLFPGREAFHSYRK